MKYIQPSSIINEYIDFSEPAGELKKTRLLKLADFLVSKMPYTDKYIHKIKLLEVRDYQADLPNDFDSLIQLAFCANKSYKVNRVEIVEWTKKMYDGSGCELVITQTCDKCNQAECCCDSPEMVVDVDRLWELNHPEFKYGHMAWYYRHGGLGNDNVPVSPYHPTFKLIRPTRDPLFDTDKFIKGCVNLNGICSNSVEEFKLDESVIRFNVRSGWALLSYFAVPVDEDGWRLIPDVPELVEAITWYIEERLAFINYKRTGNQALKRDYLEARYEKEKFMGMAREILTTQNYHEFQRDLGAFYGKFLPMEDSRGHVTDMYQVIMNRIGNV